MNKRRSGQPVRRRNAREEITERIASRAFSRLNGVTSSLRSRILFLQRGWPYLSLKTATLERGEASCRTCDSRRERVVLAGAKKKFGEPLVRR